MYISKKYALELIRNGKAKKETELNPDENGKIYIAITRFDLQRTDHYEK